MWIMWTTSILAAASSVAAQMVDSYHSINTFILLVLLIIASVGLGGFWANVIQFGLDQLQDASTTEITAFISWFIWTYMSGGIAINFAYTGINKEYHILGQLYVCICLTMALILLFLSSGLLVKEPVTQNPLKLVYRVIRFAIKKLVPKMQECLHLL